MAIRSFVATTMDIMIILHQNNKLRSKRYARSLLSILFACCFIILLLCACGTFHNSSEPSENFAITRSIDDCKNIAQAVLSDTTLLECGVIEVDGGKIRGYCQSPEEYGASSHETWIIWQGDNGDELLLQDGGLSNAVGCSINENIIYVVGRYYGFATLTGLNVVKYTITQDQILIEAAINESSIDNRFTIITDEKIKHCVLLCRKPKMAWGR